MNNITGNGYDENQRFQYCIAVHQSKILAPVGSDWQPFERESFKQLGLTQLHHHYVGEYLGKPCRVIATAGSEIPTGLEQNYEWHGLRSQIGSIPDALFRLAARAVQLVEWFESHRFCGRCAAPTALAHEGRAMVCGTCTAEYYPRIAPCVIGLITRGDRCLLARNARFPDGYYSALAGFIEPGESAEEAFAREVSEEVSLAIGSMRYFGSQPWPFPGQLMLAYFAEYNSGDIRVDGREIIEASWFHPKNLPLTPPPSTISGQLIQQFAQQVIHSGN